MNGLGRKKQKKEEKQPIFTPETFGVVLCLFATLCAVCLITREKVFSLPGQSINAFLFGCFGMFAYAVCLFAMIIGVCLITGKKTGINARQKTIITLAFTLTALLLHAISMRDYSSLPYGEYLTQSYNMAANGGATASAGGLVLSLICYPITALLTNVGAYVIISILIGIVLYFAGKALVKVYKEKGQNADAEKSVDGVEVMGEREYPVQNVDFNSALATENSTASANGAVGNVDGMGGVAGGVNVVVNGNDVNGVGAQNDRPLYTQMADDVYPFGSASYNAYSEPTQQVTPNQNVNPTENNTSSNNKTVNPQSQPYSETQGWTMQDKLDYILRPMTYEEMNKRGITNSGTRVSGYVNPRRAETNDADVSSVPPMYEHNGTEEVKSIDEIVNFEGINAENGIFTDGTVFTDGAFTTGSGVDGNIEQGQAVADDAQTAGNTADGADDVAARAEDFTARYVENGWADNEQYYTEETIDIDGNDDEPREVSFRPVESGFGGRVGFGASLENNDTTTNGNATANDSAAVNNNEPTTSLSNDNVGGVANFTGNEQANDTSAPDGFSPRRRSEIFDECEIFNEEEIKADYSGEMDNDLDGEIKPTSLGEGRRRGIFGDSSDSANDVESGQSDDGFIARGRRTDYTSRVDADNNGNAHSTAQKPVEDKPLSARAMPTPPIQEEKPAKPERPPKKPYVRPPIDLLENYYSFGGQAEDHEGRMQAISDKLAEFNINVEPQGYIQGPSITRYEVKMPAGVSVKKVLNYDDDLKSCLFSRFGIRIEAPIPGKNLVGIEVENKHKVTVGLRELLMKMSSEPSKPGSLVFAIGKDIVGNCISHNISKAPHYLVAGATGSGKSVALNAMIISLIMRYSPDELRLILIDPKSVGFGMYKRIPHLLIDEIITETPRALAALQWAQVEMERRYKLFAEGDIMSSDIDAYNSKLPKDAEKLPRIVFVVDELADLMESNKKEMEQRIQVLVQKSRAAGIHLVLATQRPSVNVIPGTIKANLNVRMALKVLTATDSQTILGNAGAEKLLGNGDMLFRDSAMPEAERYQGAWISDAEIANVVSFIKENNTAYFEDEVSQYLDRSVRAPQEESSSVSVGGGKGDENEVDELFLKALWLGVNSGTMSISQLIRRFQIGYGKAGGIVDKMERMGFITGNEGSKARKVLLTREQYEEKFGPASDA